jgi:hypothetical protein
MTVPTTLDAAVWLRNFLEQPDADPDLMRAMLQAFAEARADLTAAPPPVRPTT